MQLARSRQLNLALAVVAIATTVFSTSGPRIAWSQDKQPSPLLEAGHPVDWWFAFKFNAATYPGVPQVTERA